MHKEPSIIKKQRHKNSCKKGYLVKIRERDGEEGLEQRTFMCIYTLALDAS